MTDWEDEPWLDKLRYCEDGTQDDTKATDNNVSDAEERVPTTHDRARG
jgi:hypothetical protein